MIARDYMLDEVNKFINHKIGMIRRMRGMMNDDESPDLQDVYTKAEVDEMLDEKSSVLHKHAKADISDFPDALKNPRPLIINGSAYDGSSELSITVSTDQLVEDLEEFMKTFNEAILGKADSDHTHSVEDVTGIMLAMYPVDSIYATVSPVNPSSYFGGTWEPWGSGKVPVGVDSTQAEFDAVEKEGGAKTHTLSIGEMPNHDHGMIIGTSGGSVVLGSQTMNPVMSETVRTSKVGGDAAHNNLQPYITCYMWKRTE